MPQNNGQGYRCLIVDDEPVARSFLISLLARHPDFQVINEVGSGTEATLTVSRTAPDLIFLGIRMLDIEMPDMDGFEFLRAIQSSRMPLIVFVTAFDQYALRAFQVRALEYLLKPFDEERFDQVLSNVRERLAGTERTGLSRRVLDLLSEHESRRRHAERFLVKRESRMYFVRSADIGWIEAQGNYVYLHTSTEKHLLRHTLSAMETQLDPARFQRIERGAIVNVDAVREMRPWFRGDVKVILRSGAEVRLSRRFRDSFDRNTGGRS